MRGSNGCGKSTLLAALKARFQGQAYYWPTQDRLAFAFNGPARGSMTNDADDGAPEEPDALSAAEDAAQKSGYSSGERQLQVLREIVANTDSPLYLLDEWDANLDAPNRAAALALVETLAQRARVVEVSHRDRA